MIEALLKGNVACIKLRILVFGPTLSNITSSQEINPLQKKRKEICDSLNELGHQADMPEQLVISQGSSPLGNSLLQEILLIDQYDLVVVLLESPGSLVEIGVVSTKPKLAAKCQTFIRQEFKEGLAGKACELIEHLGGKQYFFNYPQDLDECHLLTKIQDHVSKLQIAKFLS